MDYNKLFQSKSFRGFLAAIAVFIVLLVAFRAGMSVGFHKADFSYRFGDNYHQNFAGPKQGFRGGMEGREYMDAHGLIGQVIKIDGGALVIKDKDNIEKIVAVAADTQIIRFKDSVKIENISINDMIIVIGEPNQSGQIEAKLIRIMPPQPGSNRMIPPPGSFPPI